MENFGSETTTGDLLENTTFKFINISWDNSTETENTDDGDWDVSTTITDKVMKIIYIIIGSIGMSGNLMVVIVLFSFTKMRKKVTNLFIINQSILDFFTATFLLFTTVLPDDGREFRTLSDDVYCRMWVGRVPLWLFLHASSYNLVALTLERYFSVVHPILHKLSFSKAKALVAIAIVWMIAIIYDISGSMSTSHIANNACILYVWKSPVAMQAVGIFGVFLNYFIPIFILVYCYSRMAYSLSSKIAPMTANNPPPVNGSQGPSSKVMSLQARGKRNIIKTLMIVSTAFILCTSWNQWFFFLFNLGVYGYSALSSTFYHFSVVAMFANCCINPFIYTAKYEEFQKGLKKIFCVCCKKMNDQKEDSQSTVETTA